MNDDARTAAEPESPGGTDSTEDAEAVSGVNGTDSAAKQRTPEGGHPAGNEQDTGDVPETGNVRGTKAEWPLYEIFVRGKRGLNHVHVGSLRAADDRMALTHARDLYTRRNEGVSLWAVRSDLIAASAPDEKDPFFAPNADKVYRHPTFYDIPADVPHI